MLKQKDLKRATLIEACIKGQCTVKQVATALGLSSLNECSVLITSFPQSHLHFQ